MYLGEFYVYTIGILHIFIKHISIFIEARTFAPGINCERTLACFKNKLHKSQQNRAH